MYLIMTINHELTLSRRPTCTGASYFDIRAWRTPEDNSATTEGLLLPSTQFRGYPHEAHSPQKCGASLGQ